MITFEYSKGHEIVGRNSEIETLRKDLEEKKIKVILLEGDLGVGKTAVANRLYEMTSPGGALAGRFNKQIYQSAYRETWERILSQLAEKLLRNERVLKATRNEIEERILQDCSDGQTLLVIDNVEQFQRADAIRFIDEWVKTSGNSILFITTRERLEINGDAIRCLRLTGLIDKYPQLELLGKQLRERFGEEKLFDLVKGLNGVPLNLLYLRWLDPQSEEELEKRVSGLIEGTLNKSWVIDDILAIVSYSPTAFMALGVIRQLDFDESLLASFWDSMGSGNSEAYSNFRDRLVSNSLLIPMPMQGAMVPRYRINEDIHKQLYQALSARIGGEGRMPTVHFFASEYYRRIFELSKAPNLDAINEFVYHSFNSNDYSRAYDYVFERDILRSLHRAGMAIQLKSLLQSFLTNEPKFKPIQRCNILIEIAHVCNDLSEFSLCLQYMDRAEKALVEGGRDVRDFLRASLLKRIWYYSAVGYSNTGHSAECLQSYFRIVSSASDPKDKLACISLAYIAHDLKYRDISKSLEYGEAALETSRSIGDHHLIAKCLCSVSESYIYCSNLSKADVYFQEAEELCQDVNAGPSDMRELGRVLKNRGLVLILLNKLPDARQKLINAKEISNSMGDRRRTATADLYLAVLHYRQGEEEEAEKFILSAIRASYGLGDGRYLVPEVMTYARWKNPGFSGDLAGLPECINCDDIQSIMEEVSVTERYQIYATFWRDHFWPTLFTSTN